MDDMTRHTPLEGVDLDSELDNALHGADDGELFLEYRQNEALSFDNGRLKNATYDVTRGFGLRAVSGESVAYAHSTDLSLNAFHTARDAVRSACTGAAARLALHPPAGALPLYTHENPLLAPDFAAKVALLETMDAYARAKDSRVKQVSLSLAASWQQVDIRRPGGFRVTDVRPMVRFYVSIIAANNERQEQGGYGRGGRVTWDSWLTTSAWQEGIDEALRQALVLLDSRPAPAGAMDVVLGPGWPGVMLHEAVGHGLEGDFIRKTTSAFAGLLGERVAAPGVTVMDDGTLANQRGAITVDDEGTPSRCTVLIEDGILKGFMQDRQNAALLGVAPTGNGRRESFAHVPMPRMTNTYMRSGTHDPQEIIASVKKGVYAAHFGGGQVDITSGKYVFQCTEAYEIENGKIGAPLKGAMLVGDGPSDLKKITLIGNDMSLDAGVGTCGKAGQWVPVGVGQPTLLMRGITVGGTGG